MSFIEDNKSNQKKFVRVPQKESFLAHRPPKTKAIKRNKSLGAYRPPCKEVKERKISISET
jgi:hypothetical protein